MPNCEALHRSDFYCYSFNGVSADYASYGSPMPMRRNLVQCSVVYDTTISNIYALNDTFNGAGNTGSFVGAIGTTVSNPSGNELEVSSTTVYPVISSTISTTTGKEYIVSADLNGMSFSPGYIASVLCEVIEGGVTVASQSSTAPGNFNFTYTAGAGSASVRYTFVLTPNPGPPPPPPMAPFSFTLDNAMVYFIDTSISSETVCVSKNGYRYGFNGMEKDFGLSDGGDIYTAEYWEYDSRLGRRWNIDPVFKVSQGSYNCFSNIPTIMVDPKGDDDYFNADGTFERSDNKSTNYIYIKTSDGSYKLLHEYPTSTAALRLTIAKVIAYYAKGIGITGQVGINIGTNLSKDEPSFTIGDIIYINYNGGIEPLLSNFNNLKNILIHEKDHKSKRHGFIDPKDPNKNDKIKHSQIWHIDVYITQIKDPTFGLTTEKFKKRTAQSIANFLADEMTFRASKYGNGYTGDVESRLADINIVLAQFGLRIDIEMTYNGFSKGGHKYKGVVTEIKTKKNGKKKKK